MRLMLKLFCGALLSVFLLTQPAALALAKDRTFSREVSPRRTGVFLPKDEEVVALARARRAVLAEVGSWLSTFSAVKSKMPDQEGLVSLAAAVVTVHAKGEGGEPGSGINRITLSANISDSEAKKAVQRFQDDSVLFSRFAKLTKREALLLAQAQTLESRIGALSGGGDGAALASLSNGYALVAAKLASLSLMHMAHDEYFKGGKNPDLEKAMKYYSGAARLDETNSDAFACLGLVHFAQAKYTDSVDDFTKAIAIDPKDAGLYQDRGVSFGQIGRPDFAVRDFSRAIALKPDFARAYAARAYALMLLEKTEAACKDLNKACDLGECVFLKGARSMGKCR